ncbi:MULTISPECIES: cobyric acid synthase [Thermodesulfovibrio]|jgi:adenosylcobyric acid synthase|uniref:cobyric acid synthase n=1 Tax=Thermodesulfovibrio TaxID=28261 RepID=UPI002639EBA7|nr:cobyric acid synthase [Thermodesulfovibrio sp.]
MAKSLTIQGTCSGSGKSLIVTALCRIFSRKGINVAPFKAQNISLQSYVTREGGEIAIAQAVQAEAALIEPEIHMNPILLKPSGKKGFHLIVRGKYRGVIKPFKKKREVLWDTVVSSLNNMQRKYELLIIEGAGSPAEINILEQDMANMAVAEYLKSPVLLVGDIERGGVFASLYGTVKILNSKKSFFRGFLINKFRGYRDILQPGIDKLESLLSIKCLGVIPYIDNLAISDEDGFPFAYSKPKRRQIKKEKIKIVVIPLKYISNFSDFDPLKFEPDVELAYSLNEDELKEADIIIIPGSKRTIEDLQYIKSIGLGAFIKNLAKKDKEIIGICGGFQMLGDRIIDRHQIESSKTETRGLGFLSVETIFQPEKILTQVEGSLIEKSSIKIKGYEIHMGESFGDMNLFKIKRLSYGKIIQEGMIKNNIWGTYIHGLFENDSFRRWLINRHRIKKGLNPIDFTFSWKRLKESSIEKLADLVEKNVEMKHIEEILEL